MSDALCVRCGEEIAPGYVFAIRPTICCARCCWQFSARCGIYRGVSAHAARYKYGCSKGDLRFLSSTTLLNANAGNILVFLYLEAEVDFLGNLRDKYPMMLAEDMISQDIKSRLEQRKAQLQKMLPRPWPERQTLCEIWILRQFIENPRKLSETIDNVCHRYEFIGRADHIAEECKVDFDTAAKFCVEYGGGPAEFDALRLKCRTVFELLGHRILRYLTENERQRLEDTPLEFALVKFRCKSVKPEEHKTVEKDSSDSCSSSEEVTATATAATDADDDSSTSTEETVTSADAEYYAHFSSLLGNITDLTDDWYYDEFDFTDDSGAISSYEF